MRQRNHNRRGFTLVELLVVVSMFALLLTMLMPAMGKVRQLAQAAECASNLRQCALAFQEYANENGSLFPYGRYNPPSGGELTWDSLISPYLGVTKSIEDQATDKWSAGEGPEVLTCPRDDLPRDFNLATRTYTIPGFYDQSWNQEYVTVGTMCDTRFNDPPGNGNTPIPRYQSRTKVRDPVGTILVTEMVSKRNVPGWSIGAICTGPEQWRYVSQIYGHTGPDPKTAPNWLHGEDRMNYAYVDGHVDMLDPMDTLGANPESNDPHGQWTLDPSD